MVEIEFHLKDDTIRFYRCHNVVIDDWFASRNTILHLHILSTDIDRYAFLWDTAYKAVVVKGPRGVHLINVTAYTPYDNRNEYYVVDDITGLQTIVKLSGQRIEGYGEWDE